MIPTAFTKPQGKLADAAYGPSAANTTLIAAANTVINDGVTTVAISIVVFDIAGNPLAGVTPTLAATGAGNTLTSPAATDAFGATSATFKTTGATAHVISVTSNGITSANTLTITGVAGAGTINAATSTVSIAQSSADAGAGAVLVTLQGKDAGGSNMASGGATVVFTKASGADTISISATTDVGNGTYTALVTPVTDGGSAAQLAATINTVAVSTTVPTFDVTTAASTWLLEDFSTYSSSANFKTNPRAIYSDNFLNDNNESYNVPQMSLITGAVDGYNGLTKYLRYTWPIINQQDYHIGCNLKLPSNVTEYWVELVARFSTTFTTQGPAAGNPDYKFFAARASTSGRNMLFCGTYGNGWQFGYPPQVGNNDTGDYSDVLVGAGPAYYHNTAYGFDKKGNPWDGQWHVYRFHYKIAASGAAQWTYGGQHMPGWPSGIDSSGGGHYFGQTIGANMNKGTSQAMTLDWGRIAFFNADPGWTM